jgi:hypothetical protein
MDDAWVLALRWEDLQTRVTALVDALADVGLALGPAKTQILAAPAAPAGGIRMYGELVKPEPVGTVVSALGTGVGFRIPVNTPMREACARARGAYWAQRALFQRDAPIGKRMQLFERTAQATALWNAGTYVPQKQGLQMLNAVRRSSSAI